MGLTVALDDALLAQGHLYWDDGVRIGTSGLSALPKTLFFACGNGWILPREAPSLEMFKAQIQQTKPDPRMRIKREMKQTLGCPRKGRGKGWTQAKATPVLGADLNPPSEAKLK